VHKSQDKSVILDRCVGGNEFYISALNIRMGDKHRVDTTITAEVKQT